MPKTPAPPPKITTSENAIYSATNYKDLVRELIAGEANGGRGVRRLLAEALRCQVAYISHVLAGNYHFSAEQAEACARFFALPKDEAEYFLLLVSENRAATPQLKALFQKMLDEKRLAQRKFQARTGIREAVNREDQATYYSHWHFAAVHMLLTIPSFRTPEAIRRRLKLSPKVVQHVLRFLVRTGLALQEGNAYVPGAALFHLDEDSPLIPRHHANWRLAAMQALGDVAPHDIHYSGVVSLAAADLPRVRERMAKCLQDCTEIIRPSAEERLAVICLDWFEV